MKPLGISSGIRWCERGIMMEKSLKEKLQLIAIRHHKNENLSTYVRNGHSMWLDEENHLVKFNHVSDQEEAQRIIDNIISAFKECGYTARFLGRKKLSNTLFEYVIEYQYH